MKKMKKILALVLVALMLVTVLAACGNDSGSTPTGGTNTEQPGNAGTEGTKSFQFYGAYTEEGEFASMLNAAFLLDLNADGTAVCDRYNFSNYDDSDAASNPTYIQSYLSGTWKEVEKDGVPCLQIKIAYVGEDGSESDNQTAYAYDVAGVYSFDMNFPVMIVPEEYANQLSDEEITSFRRSEAGISWILGSPAIPITVTVYRVGGNYPADGYLRTSTLCFPFGGWRTQHADGLDRYDIWADGIKEPVGDRLSGMG